jgi:hypothetical protein
MKIKFFIFCILCLLFWSCKKNKDNVFNGSDFAEDSFVFKPCSLIPEPAIGWSDSTEVSNKYFSSAIMNPIKPSEFFYITMAKIYSFDRASKVLKVLCYNVNTSRFDINKKGDILFCGYGGKICSIKSNGDSIKVFNFNANFFHWDYSGNFIYFFQNSKLMKLDKNGVLITSISNLPQPIGYTNYSDRIVCANITGKTLYLKDINSGIETPLLSNISQGYGTICTDKNDENLYWNGYEGVCRLNLTTLKLDTLIKSCPYGSPSLPSNPNTMLVGANISTTTNYLTVTYKESIPINSFKKYTICKGLLMDLATNKIIEIKGMP